MTHRGVAWAPEQSENRDDYENRLATALMALFRDTRATEAFEALYDFTGSQVLHWIRSLTGREVSGLDPQEALQDTFVNVYRYPTAFRDDHAGSFRVWVRTIAGNVVRRGSGVLARGVGSDLDDQPELVDPGRGPAQLLSDEDETQRLRRAWVLFLCLYAEAWKELSPRDRRTLHLVEVEGLSYEAAGRELGVGRSNMKMIVFRSRRRIARRIRAALGAEGACLEDELVA